MEQKKVRAGKISAPSGRLSMIYFTVCGARRTISLRTCQITLRPIGIIRPISKLRQTVLRLHRWAILFKALIGLIQSNRPRNSAYMMGL